MANNSPADPTPEAKRLKAFWNSRYAEFSLRESGIKTLTPVYSRLLYRCKRAAYLRAVDLAAIERTRPQAILDGGCGQGYFATVVQQSFVHPDYVGVDISEKAIAFLKDKIPGCEWRCGDLADPLLQICRSFDLAQSIEVLHLIIDDANQTQAISNLARHLRPGGVLILTDTLPPRRYHANAYIVFRPLAYYKRLFAQLDLDLIARFPMYYCIPDQSFGPAWLRRLCRLVPPPFLFVLDRAALALRFPQWRPSHDSLMKMMVCRKKS